MSFNIGPYMGKRDAVIKAVKADVDRIKKYGGDSLQAETAAVLLLSELERLPESKGTCARAYGHADPSSRNLMIEVGQMAVGCVPMYVE